MFVYVGKSITTPGDTLIKISLKELISKIIHPKLEFVERMKQIRIAQTIDSNRYKELKKTLPYFTCGHFHPLIRKKDNFTSINCFVIDLDHLSENDIQLAELKTTLRNQKEIVAFFVSPSSDGLKIIFNLNEAIKDAGLFKAFYKIFSQKFSIEHKLENCIDLTTSDVTRACFISHDPEAYYNDNFEAIHIEKYINFQDFEIAENQIKEAEKFVKEINKIKESDKLDSVTDDVLQQIKLKLNPKASPTKTKNIYLPPEIDEFIPLLEESLIRFNIELIEKTPIHYGRKLKFKIGIHWAELNLFYGKKGYSIIKTPKTGSNAELANSCFQIVQEVLEYKENG